MFSIHIHGIAYTWMAYFRTGLDTSWLDAFMLMNVTKLSNSINYHAYLDTAWHHAFIMLMNVTKLSKSTLLLAYAQIWMIRLSLWCKHAWIHLANMHQHMMQICINTWCKFARCHDICKMSYHDKFSMTQCISSATLRRWYIYTYIYIYIHTHTHILMNHSSQGRKVFCELTWNFLSAVTCSGIGECV